MSWKSNKLKYVNTSTSEAEYIGAYVAMKEALFIGFLLMKVFKKDVFPINLYCDNKGVLDTLNHGKPAEMTKYMMTKHFKLLE